jgi:hypothetical protein
MIKSKTTVRSWYNKPLASATLVAVPLGGKNAELDPNPKKKKKIHAQNENGVTLPTTNHF